jgi:hypothetical protein
VVCVFSPISVVGAICPPVMPYIVLLTKNTASFSPRLAACIVSFRPIDARSPSPW